MAGDIFEQVREEILKEDAKSLPWVPKNLDKTWETQAGIAGAIAGALAGASLGMHMGLAGAWGAIAGTIPCAIVGGVIGYFSGAKVGSTIQRDKPLSFGANQRGPATIAATDQTKQIQSLRCCPYCYALKEQWWDTQRDCCGKCGQSASRGL